LGRPRQSVRGRGVSRFGLRFADYYLRAVERQALERQVEARAVAMKPCGPDRLPEVAFVVLGHGVNTVARAVGCLAHGMFFRLELEAMHLARLRWGAKTRAQKRYVQRLPRRGTA
jgi:hypothetical protein